MLISFSVIATLQSTLKLLSDPTRLRILLLLDQEELAVQELVSITGMSQSRISNHLSLLKRAGLVRDRREGSWSFHELVSPHPEGPLTPELYQAVIAPAHAHPEHPSDGLALEAVREQRRERSRRVHDRLAAEWSAQEQSFAEGSLRGQAYSFLVPAELCIADLGCGTGFLSSFLAGRGARVIAVDHAKAMLDVARDRQLKQVEYRQGELEKLPIEDGECDAAFANLVWHHLADPQQVLREVARILRPGGRIVITDLLPHQEDWLRESQGDLRLGLRPEDVVADLARAGFTALHSETLTDRYVVERGEGRTARLPLFLCTGVFNK